MKNILLLPLFFCSFTVFTMQIEEKYNKQELLRRAEQGETLLILFPLQMACAQENVEEIMKWKVRFDIRVGQDLTCCIHPRLGQIIGKILINLLSEMPVFKEWQKREIPYNYSKIYPEQIEWVKNKKKFTCSNMDGKTYARMLL